jgi:hypothetical protein
MLPASCWPGRRAPLSSTGTDLDHALVPLVEIGVSAHRPPPVDGVSMCQFTHWNQCSDDDSAQNPAEPLQWLMQTEGITTAMRRMSPSIPPQRDTVAENRDEAVAHPNPPMIDRVDHAPPSAPADGPRGEKTPDEEPPGSSWTQKVSPKINLWAAILSALAAVAALLLSIVASVQQNSSPELSMTSPRRILLGVGARGDSWNITIQPIFTIDRESGQTTTVTDLTLELQNPRGESVHRTPVLPASYRQEYRGCQSGATTGQCPRFWNPRSTRLQ